MPAKLSRFGTGFIFGDRETGLATGWTGIGLAVVARVAVVLTITAPAIVVLPVVLLPIIVLLNGERRRQQALKGLLIQHQSGSGRRHVFGRGGKFWLTLL